MTGVELMLLLIGSVFMIGSFFVTEKLSPSELNKLAELSEDELKKIIERGLLNAESSIENSIDEQLEASVDKVDRALEKETNDKIMAISEYSDTVLEGMNKTHNEIMFLYSMLNDKHTELTGMVSELQRLAADVRNLEENMQVQTLTDIPQAAVTSSTPMPAVSVSATSVSAVSEEEAVPDMKQESDEEREEARPLERDNVQQEILAMHREGASDIEIARELGMGVGEVRLVIGLYRGV